MKNFVSSTKLIQKPVIIGTTWMSSSRITAGSTIRYGNQERCRRRGAGGSVREDGVVVPRGTVVVMVPFLRPGSSPGPSASR